MRGFLTFWRFMQKITWRQTFRQQTDLRFVGSGKTLLELKSYATIPFKRDSCCFAADYPIQMGLSDKFLVLKFRKNLKRVFPAH